MRSSESLSSATRRPCAPSCKARAGSARTFRSAEASPSASPCAPRAPVRPCSTSSPTPPGLGRDDGDSGGHRLDDGERAALVVAREQRALGLGQERGHVFPVAEEPHTVDDPELRRELLGVGAQRPVADHVQLGLRDLGADGRQRAQREVRPLRRSKPADHQDPPADRSARQREALELDAVRDHAVLLRPPHPGREARLALVSGERDDRPAPVRGEPLEPAVELRLRAVRGPERPAVRREHARALPAARKRGEPPEEPGLRRVDVDHVGPGSQPLQRLQRARVPRSRPPVRLDRVQLDSRPPLEALPGQRAPRTGDVDREPAFGKRADEGDDMARNAAVERLRGYQEAAWRTQESKGIVR